MSSHSSTEPIHADRVLELMDKYRASLENEVQQAWSDANLDFAHQDRFEVLGALLSRQVRLVTIVTCNPLFSDIDIGLIIIRCMAETRINLKWLAIEGVDEDFERFIDYGMGQEKLYIEHAKALKNSGLSENIPNDEYIKYCEAVVAYRKLPSFTVVDVSDWSNKSVRDRAYAVGCDELYKLAYIQGSAFVHGSWNALFKTNMQICKNPLHKLHLVPVFPDLAPSIEISMWAMDIMNDTFEDWSSAVCDNTITSSAFAEAKAALYKLFGWENNSN